MTEYSPSSFISDPFISSYSLYFYLCKVGFFSAFDNVYVRNHSQQSNLNLRENDWVFLVPEAYHLFQDFAFRASCKFNLIFGRSDTTFDSHWVSRLAKFPINHIYAQNCTVLNHPKVTPIPLGIENLGWGNSFSNPTNSIELLRLFSSQRFSVEKDITLLACFGLSSNKAVRRYALTSLLNHPDLFYLDFPTVHSVNSQSSFYSHILRSKFVLCPHGNGIDTHRFWLTLYLGAIPITLNSPVYRSLCTDLPVLLIDDWSKLNIVDLHSIYNDLSPRFSNLSLIDSHSLISSMVRRVI